MLGNLVGGKEVGVADEVGVAADLAQLEEGVEDGDLGLRDSAFGDGVAHALVHGDADGFVEILLDGGEFDGVDEDGFGREVFGDFVFGAAQNEGGEAGAEGVAALEVVFLFDGVLVAGAKGAEVAEEAGDEEMKEGPEFGEVVFDGGAAEAEAVLRFQFPGGDADFGLGVFDELGFVEDGELEGVLLEFFDIALEESEGGDDDVGVGDGGVGFGTLGAGEGKDAQAGGELFGFGGPVRDHGGGGDDEGGGDFTAFASEEEGEGLDRFAEAHVVGEDAVEVVLGEGGHPFVADLLVGAEVGLQAFGFFFLGCFFLFGKVFAELLEGGAGGLDVEFFRDGGGVDGVEGEVGVEDDGEVVEDLAEAVDGEVEGGAVGEVDKVSVSGGLGGKLVDDVAF